MNNAENPIARQHGLVIQELRDEVLVYDIESNKAHCLNASAAFVWRACDGTNSVMDIAREFETNGKGKVTEDFIWLAIDQSNESGLLKYSIAPRFQGRSRRHILKTIGLASVVAVPVIASLVAPRSAMASVNCACNNSAQCVNLVGCPSSFNCNGNGICAP